MSKDMKQTIADTFTELMKVKDIDKITVTELVDECHISRQTFYYHYQDLTDVLEWIIDEIVDTTLEKSLTASNLYESISIFVKECQIYQPQLLILMRSQRRYHVEHALIAALSRALKNGLEIVGLINDIDPDEQDLFIDFYTYGIIGFIFDHKLSDPQDVDRIISHAYMLISHSVENIEKRK